MNDYVEKGESSFFFLLSTAKQARRQEAMKYKQNENTQSSQWFGLVTVQKRERKKV